jgi:hypothetical protein
MSADKGLQLDKTGIPHRPSDATIMRSASGGAIMPYSFRRTLPDASQAAFSRLPEAHTLVMSDRPIVPPPASDRSSPNALPGPVFSIAELARSWAGVTGEAWEGILYRLGDWAITDPFPDDAFLTGAETDTSFHKKVIYDRIRWHRDLVEKIRRIADHKKRGRLQKYADIHMRAAEVAVLTRDVVLKACRAMNVAPPPILGLVTDTSAEHAVPPDRALKSPVGVFAREAEQDQRHHVARRDREIQAAVGRRGRNVSQ